MEAQTIYLAQYTDLVITFKANSMFWCKWNKKNKPNKQTNKNNRKTQRKRKQSILNKQFNCVCFFFGAQKLI